MGGLDVSYLGALTAGLLSFLSPCVLPLVPPYLCFLGGVSLDQLTGAETTGAAVTRRVFAAALAFVFGFTTVFVALGATSSLIGKLVAEYLDPLAKVAGVIIILLGLHFIGVFKVPFLMREARVHVESRPAGLLGAYVVGLAFAFGWTPCVGPVLAAILFVAASKESAVQGATLLAVYALGIGVPFLLASLAAGPFTRFMAKFRRHVRTIEIVMGLMLVGTGILFLTGFMSELAYWILETFPALGKVG